MTAFAGSFTEGFFTTGLDGFEGDWAVWDLFESYFERGGLGCSTPTAGFLYVNGLSCCLWDITFYSAMREWNTI